MRPRIDCNKHKDLKGFHSGSQRVKKLPNIFFPSFVYLFWSKSREINYSFQFEAVGTERL